MIRACMMCAVLLLAAALPAQGVLIDHWYTAWLTHENESLCGHQAIEWSGLGGAHWWQGVVNRAAGPMPATERKEMPQDARTHKACWLLSLSYRYGIAGSPYDGLRAEVYYRLARSPLLPETAYFEARQASGLRLDDAGIHIDTAWLADRDDDWLAAVARIPAGAFLVGAAQVRAGQVEAGLSHLTMAANQGCTPARVFMGEYLISTGDHSGADWLRQAGTDTAALCALGRYHAPGGPNPSLELCRQAYEQAAELGSVTAQHALAPLPSLPPHRFEDLTVDLLWDAYLAAWLGPIDIEGGIFRSAANPVLLMYPKIGLWLEQRLPPAGRGDSKVAVMYAECRRRGICGCGYDLHEARRWALAGYDVEGGAGIMMLAEIKWFEDVYNQISSGIHYFIAAFEESFKPARRLAAMMQMVGFWSRQAFRAPAELKLSNKQALEILEDCVAKGDTASLHFLQRRALSPEELVSIYRRGVEAGDAHSALELARLLIHEDPRDAVRLFKLARASAKHFEAAEAGLAYLRRGILRGACDMLLAVLEDSLNRHGDAAHFMRENAFIAGVSQQALLDGHKSAGVVHGLCLLFGHGITANVAEAKRLLTRYGGDGVATFLVALIYEQQGDTTELHWCLEAAADADFAAAAHKLGMLKRESEPEVAFARFEQAANAGCLPAMLQVALAYKDGHGVPADDAKARQWAQQAADEGHEPAQALLRAWD